MFETEIEIPEPVRVVCLGWCGKTFMSPDRYRVRFCKRCTTKKEQNERNVGRICNSAIAISEE